MQQPRELLHRAVELGNDGPSLSPAESERLPAYALWHQHRDSIERLTALLQERQPPVLLAQHPLRHLSARLAGEDRPLEVAGHRLLVDPQRLRKEYLRNFQTFCSELRAQASAMQIDYHLMRTDEPVEKALGIYLTKRQSRR